MSIVIAGLGYHLIARPGQYALNGLRYSGRFRRRRQMKRTRILLFLFGLTLFSGASRRVTAQYANSSPLSIKREGYLFAGGKYSTVDGRRVMSGQIYAEFQI